MKPSAAFGLMVLWLVPALAGGQPKSPSQPAAPNPATTNQTAEQAAEEHRQKGDTFFESGNYEWAADEYAAAYDLTDAPDLLFLIGRCHEEKGEKQEAVVCFKGYLTAEPEGPLAEEASTRVAKLSAEIEYEEEAAQKRREEEEAERARREKQRLEEERRRVLLEQAFDRKREQMLREAWEREVAATRAAAIRACHRLRMRQAGLVAMGVGALSLALGAKFAFDAQSANDALSNHIAGAWTDELLARQEEGERAELRMRYFTGFGLAAVTAGGVLYLLGRRGSEQREADLTVAPSIGSSHASLSVAGRF